MTKSEIRIDQKKRRDELTKEQRHLFDESILSKLLGTKEYQDCKRLFTYISFQAEINTLPIIAQAFLQGKQVYVPKVEAHGMEFYEISSMEGLQRSNYGILEPIGCKESRYVPLSNSPNQKDNIMLLPGLAFDSTGNRIGYGAGYYDRYLNLHPKDTFYKIALAYDFQMIERVPAKEFDVRADAIITPTTIHSCVKS